MVEEVKETKECCKKSAALLKWLLGIVFLILGIWGIVVWCYELIGLIKGCIGPLLVLAALITFAVAKE